MSDVTSKSCRLPQQESQQQQQQNYAGMACAEWSQEHSNGKLMVQCPT
jgi:hypothetical protein